MRFNAGFGPIFPACCVICYGQPVFGLDMCSSCLGHLTPRVSKNVFGVSALCPNCGTEHRGDNCSSCAGNLPLFARIVCPYRFVFPLDRMIHSLKYGRNRTMGRVLGELLAYGLAREPSADMKPTVVIPVPLHANRQATRGFNHAADIARFASRRLHLPFSEGLARRVEDTESLAGLSRPERELLIRGAFSVSDAVADQRIAIVDDVMTSGATSGELARELYDTGAASVELWVVARTPLV